MVEAMLSGLGSFTLAGILAMLVGVLACQVVLILPGLGGHFVLVMMLPFLYTLDPLTGIALMTGAAVTTGTGNTVTGVLFGVPGSGTGIATTFDGYPLAQQGQGARAVAAGLGASAVGGLIGVVLLASMLPVVRPVILALGSPEYFVLVVGALLFMAYLGTGDVLKALLSGGLGLMLAMVGQENSTGTLRYTFDILALWDGIGLVPFFVGLYAVAEMLSLMKRGGSIAQQVPSSEKGLTVAGLLDVFRHWRVTLQSSVIGMAVGLIPGLGQSASQFVAYSSVARTSKDPGRFGKGAIEGVIAADASVNATDAGALVPTLAFAIPGSTTGAILLAALVAVGVQPGPEMLTTHLDVVWMIIWILVFANLFAAGIVLLFSQYLAKLTFIESSYLIPTVLTISFFAAYATGGRKFTELALVLLFGVLGFFMAEHDYSRATMVIGYVLGGILERHYLLSMRMFGPSFLLRPLVVAMIVVFAALLLGPPLRAALRRRRARSEAAGHGQPKA